MCETFLTQFESGQLLDQTPNYAWGVSLAGNQGLLSEQCPDLGVALWAGVISLVCLYTGTEMAEIKPATKSILSAVTLVVSPGFGNGGLPFLFEDLPLLDGSGPT